MRLSFHIIFSDSLKPLHKLRGGRSDCLCARAAARCMRQPTAAMPSTCASEVSGSDDVHNEINILRFTLTFMVVPFAVTRCAGYCH